MSRDLDPSQFGQLTASDDVFTVLVDGVQRTAYGRRFLQRVADALSESGSKRYTKRIRLLTEA